MGQKSYCLLSNPHFYAHSKLPAVVSVTTPGGLLANLPVSIVSFTELSAPGLTVFTPHLNLALAVAPLRWKGPSHLPSFILSHS